MTDLNIINVEEEIEKLKNQIIMHEKNIIACEGAISYLKMMAKNEQEK